MKLKFSTGRFPHGPALPAQSDHADPLEFCFLDDHTDKDGSILTSLARRTLTVFKNHLATTWSNAWDVVKIPKRSRMNAADFVAMLAKGARRAGYATYEFCDQTGVEVYRLEDLTEAELREGIFDGMPYHVAFLVWHLEDAVSFGGTFEDEETVERVDEWDATLKTVREAFPKNRDV